MAVVRLCVPIVSATLNVTGMKLTGLSCLDDFNHVRHLSLVGSTLLGSIGSVF